jgi:hypothetical protein
MLVVRAETPYAHHSFGRSLPDFRQAGSPRWLPNPADGPDGQRLPAGVGSTGAVTPRGAKPDCNRDVGGTFRASWS